MNPVQKGLWTTVTEELLSNHRRAPDKRDYISQLIYADWLEEHGTREEQTLTEYIRLQAVLGTGKWNGESKFLPRLEFIRLRQRNEELLNQHEQQKRKIWRTLASLGANDVEYFGWLPYHIEISPRRFLECGKAIMTAAPITSLCLRNNNIGDNGVQELVDSPYLMYLTSVHLGGNLIGDNGAQALAHSPHLGCLTSLRLGVNNIGDKGVESLTTSPYISHLKSLDMRDNQIGNEAMMEMAKSKTLQFLSSLHLISNNIGDTGIRSLTESASLPNLTCLYLGCNRITLEGVRALASRSNFQNLTCLDLGGNNVGVEGAQVLSTSTQFGRLTYLDMRATGIGWAGLLAIAQSQNFSPKMEVHADNFRGAVGKLRQPRFRDNSPGSEPQR